MGARHEPQDVSRRVQAAQKTCPQFKLVKPKDVSDIRSTKGRIRTYTMGSQVVSKHMGHSKFLHMSSACYKT